MSHIKKMIDFLLSSIAFIKQHLNSAEKSSHKTMHFFIFPFSKQLKSVISKYLYVNNDLQNNKTKYF